ncbi:MAG: thioredoxin domain-containing protein [Syntrophobacteraceae bacterium]|nr:thioredoxin domain-containing protein [Syntrophobacteraceae bacterium]
MLSKKRKILLISLSGAGLLFAVLAGAAEHVPWLHALCTGWGDGCRETATYTLFRIPLWIYGVGFYVVLGGAVLIPRLQPGVDWLVSLLLGVEATLVVMMVQERLLCVYCLGNLLVVLGLFFATFRKEAFWRVLSLSLAACLVSFHSIVSSAAVGQPAAKRPEPSRVAARVGGREIGMDQVETPLTGQIYDLKRQIHRLMREKLDDLIVESLLQQEAAARKVTVQELIDGEVMPRGIAVTDAEVDQYYLENRARLAEWKGSLEELRNRIRTALQQQKALQQTVAYAWTLQSKYPVADFLEEPPSPYAMLSVGSSPSLGPEDAAVTVFEFSDYECPSCRQAHEVVRQVRAHFGPRIRWVFKDYPLKRHEYARGAAEAARCAADQGKFWEYQDLLYGSKEDLTQDQLRGLAAQLGLDAGDFGACIDQGRHKAAVDKDLEDIKKAGLDRTPSFVINGKLVTGSHSFDRFVQMIEEELKMTRKRP